MPSAPSLDSLLRHSVGVIRENQDAGGAYAASPSVETYRMSWLRDGAFIADAVSRVGERESAEAYFGWVARLVEARADRVRDLVRRHGAGEPIGKEEHLHCRYTPDGREGEEPWSNHQLDGWGMWLWAVDGHMRRHEWDPAGIGDALGLVTRYVAEFALDPCFDWWEERWGRHVATLAAVYGGLGAAAGWTCLDDDVRAQARARAEEVRWTVEREAVGDGRLMARLDDGGIDSSLLACATPFGLFDAEDPVMERTVAALEREVAHGGVHRYPGDHYYGGGEWLLLSALLGWWAAQAGRVDLAQSQLEWVASKALEGGDLPEQVSDHLLVPEAYAAWEAKWGPPPVPLLWSHAWFLVLALELGHDVGS